VEVPDLVGDVRDTVGLEHQTGAELVTCALQFLSGDALFPDVGDG
jgi:hypothetical protein